MFVTTRQAKNKRTADGGSTAKAGTVYDVFIRYKTADGYKTYGKRGFLTKKECVSPPGHAGSNPAISVKKNRCFDTMCIGQRFLVFAQMPMGCAIMIKKILPITIYTFSMRSSGEQFKTFDNAIKYSARALFISFCRCSYC